MCLRSTFGKSIDRLYRQFSSSVSDSDARIWRNCQSVVCGWFEPVYLSWRNTEKMLITIFMFVSNANNAVQRPFGLFPRNAPLKILALCLFSQNSISDKESKIKFIFSMYLPLIVLSGPSGWLHVALLTGNHQGAL